MYFMRTNVFYIRMKFVAAIFIQVVAVCSAWPSPVVRNLSGAVRGRIVRAANGRYAQEYLNIPYAQSPVGVLRFRAPHPVGKWNGEHDGTRLGNACVQSDAELGKLFIHSPYKLDADLNTISEDCLTVNIYMPYNTAAEPTSGNTSTPWSEKLLPILIWIHGGGFQWGSNNLAVYNASILATEINAIVVTINYRLGALGFFRLAGVDGVSGNQGLLDQALAIRWVHDNARRLGGDPEQITLWGQSAGAASVQYHTFSSMSSELFARSVMQSGSAASFWAYHSPEQARKASRSFAAAAGCDDREDDRKLFECSKSKSLEEILDADRKIQRVTKMPLKPTLDGVFLKKSSSKHLREGDFKHAPVMIGGTTNESLWSLSVWPEEILYKLPDVRLSEQQFDSMLSQMTLSLSNASRDAIKFFYRDWTVSDDDEHAMSSERWRVLKTVCDDLFNNNGMIETLDAYVAANVPIHRYQFEQISKVLMFGYNYSGVVHCDDVPFFFGHPLDPAFGYPKEEVDFTRKLLQLFSRFVHTGELGSHSVDAQSNSSDWPSHDRRSLYVAWSATNYGKIDFGPERRRFEFWNRGVPYLEKLETHFDVA